MWHSKVTNSLVTGNRQLPLPPHQQPLWCHLLLLTIAKLLQPGKGLSSSVHGLRENGQWAGCHQVGIRAVNMIFRTCGYSHLHLPFTQAYLGFWFWPIFKTLLFRGRNAVSCKNHPDYGHGCEDDNRACALWAPKSQLFPYNIKVGLSVLTLTREAHLMGRTAASLLNNFRTQSWDSVSPLVKQFNHVSRHLSEGTYSSLFSFVCVCVCMYLVSLQFASLWMAMY